jgi:hypothetical protein
VLGHAVDEGDRPGEVVERELLGDALGAGAMPAIEPVGLLLEGVGVDNIRPWCVLS